ncbi:MAG: metallophosphoesterase family protein [Phycisphaerae bacterium]|nr:metallophosphoesterase family protein [Phycisphaerae bacterium]
MLAIISDIHSNLEALSAVLADVDARGIRRVVCLGDVIGYGPNPRECLDLVQQRCSDAILGNHDYATLYEPTRFNFGAEEAVFWTRATLENDPDPAAVARRWEFMGSLEIRRVLDGPDFGDRKILLVHGSPRRPVNEYLFPDDTFNVPAKLAASFERFRRVCFVGHTHLPGVFTDEPEFISPEDADGVFRLTRKKTLINVGSVGQPRDRDPRACYVILEEELIRFVRVEYDVKTTMEKIRAIPELDDYLAIRLEDGR